MKQNTWRNAIAMIAPILACTVALPPVSAQSRSTITLDAGTVIPVRLKDRLSSLDSKQGDGFTAVVQSQDDVQWSGLPAGTEIEGTVTRAKPKQGKDAGVLGLRFDRIMLPNERTYDIKGSLIGLDDKSVTHDENGRIVAKEDHKNKELLYAGYGAGAGLILAAITKGNTLLDTVLGGGLGYLFGKLDKSQGSPRDVVLKPDTQLGVRLDRSVDISYYGDPNDNNRNDNYGNDNNRDAPRNYHRTQPDPYDDPTRYQDDNLRGIDSRMVIDDRPDGNYDSYTDLGRYRDIRDNGTRVTAYVNDQRVSFRSDARPFISNGTVMVPAIPVLNMLNARYSYNSSRFSVTGAGEPLLASFGSRVVAGSSRHRYELPAAVQRRNYTIYVPMQFLAIVSGKRLRYDSSRQAVYLGGSRYGNGSGRQYNDNGNNGRNYNQ